LLVVSAAVGCGTEAPAPAIDQPERGVRMDFASGGIRLASGTTADGRDLQLRVIRDDGGLCLLVKGVDADLRGCGRMPREGAVRAEATVARKGADHVELFAVTSSRVARVRVRVGKSWVASTRSRLLRADDIGALHEAGIDSGPFGYFFAEIPRTSRTIRAVALDAEGNTIGGDDFDHLADMGELFVTG
jgi:hypothetical protein